jgi:hypothetical protein
MTLVDARRNRLRLVGQVSLSRSRHPRLPTTRLVQRLEPGQELPDHLLEESGVLRDEVVTDNEEVAGFGDLRSEVRELIEVRLLADELEVCAL